MTVKAPALSTPYEDVYGAGYQYSPLVPERGLHEQDDLEASSAR